MKHQIKVLIVCSGNSGYVSPFIAEQAASLQKKDINIDFFLISVSGMIGYLKNYGALIKKIKSFDPNIIHSHYGFSGMLSVLQRKVPVVITFHGSDVYVPAFRIISKAAFILSKYSIFVHENMVQKMGAKRNFSIISCGVNTTIFHPLNKNECRKKLNFDIDKKYILFSSNFTDKNKNSHLAKKAINLLNYDVELIELKNYKPDEVNLLMNAVDLVLVTSLHESGPLVVKEALSCNCPVVSTDVGDAKVTIGDVKGCYITDFDASNISEKIKIVLNSNQRINGKNRISDLELTSEIVAEKISNIYKSITTSY